jgi:hypothetical protein
MDKTYEEYRLRAAYCREMSLAAASPLMQAEWHRLANTWLAMIPPKDRDLGGESSYRRLQSASFSDQRAA